jgi:AbiU2
LKENFWLDRIRDKSEDGILFICGVSHVERFWSLLEANGLQAVILHKDWIVESKLEDILAEGIILDVHEADLANQLATFIGNNTEVLNSEYPYLFGDLQRIMTVWAFLAIARVFEEKNPRSPYPLRTIPEALKLLETGNILIENRSSVISALNVDEAEKMRFAQASDADFLTLICQYFRERMRILGDAIEKVKEKRDKVVAHREAIDEVDLARPQWGEIDDLIAFAKSFYEVVGEGIIGRSIASDAGRLTRSFKRLLTKAGVAVS